MIGNTLSHYKIIEKLGQGGQGEVYLAEDSRLDRKVALKILPEHLSDRAELRERFEREARAVSSLNHPHICTLYDIGEQDGIHFLVMEHLVGETLEARLARGPLPLEQTLEYAIQIADALDKAHRQGVVHRDLKPGNIMLVKSGAKLLDFGLAKLQAADTPTNLSALPTEQANLTAEGTILGTLQYMAPEQLEAKEADSRTDIFAFGAVVYEMATGKKAFEGKSQASLIAAIMGQDPRPMSELQPMTPALLDQVVKKCLVKEPDERWQTASDLMTGLRWVTEIGDQVSPAPSATSPADRYRLIPWSIAALVVVIAGIALWSSSPPEPSLVTRLSIATPTTAPVASTRYSDVAISPDGRHIVFRTFHEGRSQLYVRSLSSLKAEPISGTEGVDREFFLSPNSEWIGFVVESKLKKIPIAGGVPTTLCDAPLQEGGYWGPDDVIVFSAGAARDTDLFLVSANGGQPELLAEPDQAKGQAEYQRPEILPDGKSVLFDIFSTTGGYQIAALSLETGQYKILVEGGNAPHYVPTGHLVYALAGRTGTIMAAPFDLDELEITGGAIPLLEGVRHFSGRGSDYSVSSDGSLVYVSGSEAERIVVWVDREGNSQPLLDTPGQYRIPRLSPNGHVLAVANEANGGDIWTYDLERGVLSRLTFDPYEDLDPVWTPDGQRIVFFSNRDDGVRNLWWKAADGSDEAEPLTGSSEDMPQTPYSMTPHGEVLAFFEQTSANGFDIWTLQLDGDDRTPELFLSTDALEFEPAFSPDGRWIAYISNESGRNEIYVRPFPVSDGKWQISTGGGRAPQWALDGSELFYLEGDKMMAVPVTMGNSFQPGTPRVLFTHASPSGPPPAYSVSPDGKRFVMLEGTEQEEPGQVNIIQNWFEELKERVPVP